MRRDITANFPQIVFFFKTQLDTTIKYMCKKIKMFIGLNKLSIACETFSEIQNVYHEVLNLDYIILRDV